MKLTMKSSLWVLACFFLFFKAAKGQELDSDALFKQARNAAFEQKDYPQAVRLSKKALERSPDYTDIQVFLGRLYTWMDETDSARMVFQDIWKRKVTDEDFYLAYGSLEYWADQYPEALKIVDQGLQHQPGSETLLLLKAKVLTADKQYHPAKTLLDKLLKTAPKLEEARALSNRLRDQASANEIGLTYNLMHFEKQFEEDWHIIGLSYKRATAFGSLIFRTNYANKFGTNGFQYELEAYPRISKTFYMYMAAGYSNTDGIFPKFRTGASLYANLPASFEGELGFRQLHFSDNVWIYTASVGKYYRNFWFNARTYLTPGEQKISHSYAGTVRYYLQGAEDYVGLLLGTGISPEENRDNLLGDNLYKLKTFKAGLDYNFSWKNKNLFSISSTYYRVEYKPETKDNQLDVTLGYRRRF